MWEVTAMSYADFRITTLPNQCKRFRFAAFAGASVSASMHERVVATWIRGRKHYHERCSSVRGQTGTASSSGHALHLSRQLRCPGHRYFPRASSFTMRLGTLRTFCGDRGSSVYLRSNVWQRLSSKGQKNMHLDLLFHYLHRSPPYAVKCGS